MNGKMRILILFLILLTSTIFLITNCAVKDPIATFTPTSPEGGSTGDGGNGGTGGGSNDNLIDNFTWLKPATYQPGTTSVTQNGGTLTINFLNIDNSANAAGATTGDTTPLNLNWANKTTVSYIVSNAANSNVQVMIAPSTGSGWEWWECHYDMSLGGHSSSVIAPGTKATLSWNLNDKSVWKAASTSWNFNVSAPSNLDVVNRIDFKVIGPSAGGCTGKVVIFNLEVN